MLADLLNGLAKLEQDDEFRPYYARPSLAGPERCMRRLVYQAMHVQPAPLPGRALLTMDDSSWHEELTFDWIAKSVFQVHSRQMAVDIPAPGVNHAGHWCRLCKRQIEAEIIHGHIDGLLTDPLGRDTLVEHKALSFYGCHRIENGELPLDYFTQACLYSAGLQRIQPALKAVLVLIKNKNTAQYLEYELTYDAETDRATIHRLTMSRGDLPAETRPMELTLDRPVLSAMEKFRAVQAAAEVQALPARPFALGTPFPCGYCVFEVTCWAGYEEEFEALADDAVLDEELESLAKYYLEVSSHASTMEQEKEDLRAQIRAALDAKQIRGGRVGPYVIQVALREKVSWDPARIPEAVQAVAKRMKSYEVLTIRKPKERIDTGERKC